MRGLFPPRARPGPRLGAGGADRRARASPTPSRPGARSRDARAADPVLFGWSYDFVGDLAETVALIWPERPRRRPAGWPRARGGGRGRCTPPAEAELPGILVAGWLDALDATGRWALLKLVTGELAGRRLGAARQDRRSPSGRGRASAEIEEVWHGLEPPYRDALRLARGPAPAARARRPAGLPAADAGAPARGRGPARSSTRSRVPAAEWKWDGIRVQVAAPARTGCGSTRAPATRSRRAFPDIVDGGRLPGGARRRAAGAARRARSAAVQRPAAAAQPQGRRRRPCCADYPAFVRLYDMLLEGEEDLRPLPFAERRARLEAFVARERPRAHGPVAAGAVHGLGRARARCGRARAARGIEGLMLKRKDSAYVAGRPKGLWWKWKRDARTRSTWS